MTDATPRSHPMPADLDAVEMAKRLLGEASDGWSGDAVCVPATTAAEAATLIASLAEENARLTSDRPYIIGWNDGFAHVHGPLRFPTMLRKMWSGGEVQAWLDAQRIEAARQVAADEGGALHQAEAALTKAVADEREACATLIGPTTERPCDCERCYCQNVGDCEGVASWDAQFYLAQAIRARTTGGTDAQG